ncbi:Dihydrofolate reductase [Chitinophaga jiangningensis]|uniref:Dihydrofolate reductase n=1 Tax=Chitinophaga jiangningensis TaxID=1419482 RepID=A0A1M6Z547_9BACT|nr:dihydrofolate reductase family protein [Chitinophaga jiangningensis]SHL25523.1 Dihydrofolate reductase [Chitinophaga jiangningensis]
MRKIKLYIAVSLDGYIATTNDNLDWLINFPVLEGVDYGYAAFLAGIDTCLMGNETYRWLQRNQEEWAYPDLTTYVFTRHANTLEAPYVKFFSGDIPALVKELKSGTGKDIWLMGGGQINSILLEAGLIDEMIITHMPVTLGTGKPLFGATISQQQFKLTNLEKYNNGVTQMQYSK